MVRIFCRIVLLIMISIAIISTQGCGIFYCFDSVSQSPKELFESNEFIFTAYLNHADTLLNIGTLEYLGTQSNFYLVEYVFLPNEIVKSESDFTECRLWYIIDKQIEDDYWHTLRLSETAIELIYGNKLRDWQNILNVMDPLVYGSISELEGLLNGNQPEKRWNAIKDDSIIASYLLKSDKLKYLIESYLKDSILIIYGTENSMSTQFEFGFGSICYCESGNYEEDIKWVWGYSDSSEEYLDKVRLLAKENL